MGAYVGFVQESLVMAQYWHDPLNEAKYRAKSLFLADINQERSVNETYKMNLLMLSNLVLVKFNQDTMIDPKECAWFGFYKPGQTKELFTLSETELYQEDKLGLRELQDSGRLHFLSIDADHLRWSEEFFTHEIINQFLM